MGVYVLECSVIKYRKNYYVLYPIGRDAKKKLEKLHGKKVYAVIVVEE